jgi:hypothetical protein
MVTTRKAITGLVDTVSTPMFTITVPNAVVSAEITVDVVVALGAGGAIGAGEASRTIRQTFTVARTAGVAAVVGGSAVFGASTAAVAGATTVTAALATSGMTGAVGATQTFTVNIAVTKGGGASDNHTAVASVTVYNQFASGATAA